VITDVIYSNSETSSAKSPSSGSQEEYQGLLVRDFCAVLIMYTIQFRINIDISISIYNLYIYAYMYIMHCMVPDYLMLCATLLPILYPYLVLSYYLTMYYFHI